MKRAVVISTNDNDNYLFFVPVVVWAWNQLGWDVVLCTTQLWAQKKVCLVYDTMKKQSFRYTNIEIPPMYEDLYRSETLVQCSRLYVATDRLDSFNSDYLLMVSDADMLPLSDYWHPKQRDITCYGKDQSDEQYSMCYVAMAASKWREVMKLNEFLFYKMGKDLDAIPHANSNNKEEWWTLDQQILTSRLKPYEKEIVHVPRGKSIHSDYPVGRIDRSAWNATHKEETRIDCHLIRPGFTDENWPLILKEIINNLNPTMDEIKWMCTYREAYKKLVENE